MKGVSLLIKPASGLCNMNCCYCFYKDELAHSEQQKTGVMERKIKETLIRKACEEAEDWIQFAFQGGEPTLAGLDFYREFVELVKKYKKKKTRVRYAVQTNGLLLDEEWADFFHENQFLTGLSYDGNPRIHDSLRKDREEEGTSKRVEAAWKLLQEHHVETNLLCVVTKGIAKKPERVYEFLKGMGGRYLQFIPCISPIDEVQAEAKWILTAEDYGHCMKALFDLWYRDWENGSYISIRNFDDYINLMCGRRVSTCAACGQCGQYLVIENDGSVYPCDFYVQDEWYLGNIEEQSIEELIRSPRAAAFTAEKYKSVRCRDCQYYGLCRGGCKNDYKSRRKDAQTQNVFCAAYLDFFPYAMKRMQIIAEEERKIAGGKA